MDDLTYTYSGNQLTSVADAGNGNYGFRDGAKNTAEYTYDDNGNLTSDPNKEISANGITYNHLNLPKSINVSSQNIKYFYDANGRKLKKVLSTGTVTDYAGNYIYENNLLKFIVHPEGYLSSNNDSFDHIYQFKDLLGSVRLVYSDMNGDGSITHSNINPLNNEIIEENNYYPFGLKHKGYNGTISANNTGLARKFKYQGKEFEEELNVNTYAFGWRDYDPAIGRFNKPDRFAEKYHNTTPYHFSLNNPNFYREINGDSVQGISRKSARRVKRIIRKTFKNNKKLARLFKTKGKKFKGIDAREFHKATENSSDDEKALARGYVKAVNSTEIHKVEAVRRNEELSDFSGDIVGDEDKDGSITGADLEATKGGFNKETDYGTYTAIVMNSATSVTDLRDNSTGQQVNGTTFDVGSALAHELIGHGLTRFFYHRGTQHINAIQVENLYRRYINGGSRRFYRDGQSHDTTQEIPFSLSGQVPDYLIPLRFQ